MRENHIASKGTKVVTAAEMRAIDKKTIKDFGIPGAVLMERAGRSVAEKVKQLYPRQKVIVLAGAGNNGGDGIVAGRDLYNSGWDVSMFILLAEEKLSPDCLSQYRISRQTGVPIEFRKKFDSKDIRGAIIVDGILGTGLSKPVTGFMANVIAFVNKFQSPVVSIDIPSGVSSDTGEVMGAALNAAQTVTFGLPKRGHFLYPGAEHTGRLYVEDIGFPEELLSAESLACATLGSQDIILPKRKVYSHKGSYGHVLVVAGSRGKTGAALLAAKACLRAGAGRVTLAVPESLMDIVQGRVTEEMTLPLKETTDGTVSAKAADDVLDFASEHADVLAVGPGMGATQDTQKFMAELLIRCTMPLVLDADALNVLKKTSFKNIKAPLVLTPHPGEMARLIGSTPAEIEKNRVLTAMDFVSKTQFGDKGVLVLKGTPTVIAAKSGKVFLNRTGNAGMAKAGCGDVLTGMVAAFLAQGLGTLEASVAGVFIHGLAGDIAASEKGLHCLLASDVIEALPLAFAEIVE